MRFPERRPRPAPVAPEVAEIPLGIRRAAAWSWRLLLIIAGCWVVLQGMSHIQVIVIPVLVAVLLAALLGPIVTLLARHTFLGRGSAAMIVLIGLILVITGMSTLAGQQLLAQYADIEDKAVSGFVQLSAIVVERLHLDQPTIANAQQALLDKLQSNSQQLIQGALTGVETLGSAVTGTLIALFTLFFLLKDGELIWRWILRLLPRRSRVVTHEAFRRGWRALSAYVRTQILVATINGTGIGIGIAALGLGSYGVPVFLIVFLFSFIPLIGAVVSGIIAVLLVLVLKSWVLALVMVAIVIGVHFIEADILHPFMMGRAVSLHPLGVFLGVALGAETAGIAGALFAIPLAAFLNATILQFSGNDPNPELGVDSRTAAFVAARAKDLRGVNLTLPGLSRRAPRPPRR